MWNAQTTLYFVFGELMRALSISNHRIDALDIDNIANMWNAQTTPYFVFVELMRALSISNHRIDALDIKGYYTGISHQIFNLASPDTATPILAAENLWPYEY
ncbi:MAG: hypothetical protein Q9191_008096, partial [Dirinaria sp. TL-2023a]